MEDNREQSQQQDSMHSSNNKLESLPQMIKGVWSDDKIAQLENTSHFRKLLSMGQSPPINEVIQSGVVPRFVEFLSRDEFPQLQIEAAWVLTNIACGTSENTRVLIDHGAVPILVKLLSSPDDNVREEAVWALGNVAVDSLKCRDFVLEHGALNPLLALLNDHSKLSLLRIATWTLCNLCKRKPESLFDQIKPALPVLARLIHLNDNDVLSDACWALSFLSDGTNDEIQAVIDAGVCPRLVELLLHPSSAVLIPALSTVGNIANGDEMQTQCIIDHQALPCLLKLVTEPYIESIQTEACLTISNITAGSFHQIQSVIDAGIIAPLLNLLQNAEYEIKKGAALAISNVISHGKHDQIKFMVTQGCIKPLCDLLICHDPIMITVCLVSLEDILNAGEYEMELRQTNDVNEYAQLIEEAEGLGKIEELQSHESNDIYEKAVEILERFWMEEDDEEALPTGDAPQPGF